MQFRFNWIPNSCQFNSSSIKMTSINGLEFNWKEMGCKLVEQGIEFIFTHMVLKKKLLKKDTLLKFPFSPNQQDHTIHVNKLNITSFVQGWLKYYDS